jgi:hypothetical protein
MRRSIPLWVALLVILLVLLGCRTAAPPGDEPAAPARATIAGRLSGPLGTAPVAGRLVEAVEVTTGARYSTTTTVSGGFSLFVPPGRYRLSAALGRGESLVAGPGILALAPGQVSREADLVLGGAGVVDEP